MENLVKTTIALVFAKMFPHLVYQEFQLAFIRNYSIFSAKGEAVYSIGWNLEVNCSVIACHFVYY